MSVTSFIEISSGVSAAVQCMCLIPVAKKRDAAWGGRWEATGTQAAESMRLAQGCAAGTGAGHNRPKADFASPKCGPHTGKKGEQGWKGK